MLAAASVSTRRVVVPRLSDLPSRPRAGAVLRQLQGETMGTTWKVKCLAPAEVTPQRLQQGIQDTLDRVVASMSHWEPGSDLCRFNRAPAGTRVQLPADLGLVLAFAVGVARDSGGACDVTAGTLVNAWGFGPGAAHRRPGFRPPTATEIAEALAPGGWRRLQLDTAHNIARQPGGLQLDLSAVAKGFGVDEVADHLRTVEVASYLVEVGGELRGAGTKPDGQPWWVALEAPDGESVAETVVALYGLSVATSGDYLRFFDSEDRRYSHTIDPRTGHPVANGVASVTVLHADCMAADALSTALMVMGLERGLAWADERDLAALFRVRRAAAGAAGSTGRSAPISEHMSKRFADLVQ
jgi:FAD:protein FMN transferase